MRTVHVNVVWEENLELEVEDDVPHIETLDDLVDAGHDIRPFDPMTVSYEINDEGGCQSV